MDLKNLRIEKGYSLQQVADGTGLPKTSLFHWESGERQPAADVLPKLAEFYGISIDELLGYKSPKLPAVLEEPEEVFEEIRPSLYGGDKLLVPADKVEKALFNECDKVKKSFFKIGYFLTLINKYRIYQKQGYATITDYAEEKFGIGSSSAYSFMQVYEKTSKYGEPTKMDERYLPYNQSQLVEICRCRWASDTLIRGYVKPTDSAKEIQAYVSLWNKSYAKKGTMPKGDTVKEALAIAEKEKAKALTPERVESDDVPPGQMSIFDDEENERPFDEPEDESPEEKEDEFGGAEFVQGGGIDDGEEDATDSVVKSEYLFVDSETLFLKNDNERKEFLKKAENFNIPVLRNEELGLEITKRVLRNGATIYRTQFRMYSEYHKKFVDDTVLCLVDPKEEMPSRWSYEPQRNYMSYTLTGTAETYIVQYLSKHKDEI